MQKWQTLMQNRHRLHDSKDVAHVHGIEPSQALHLTVVLQLLGGFTSVTAAVVAVLSWRAIRLSARSARSSAEILAYNARHAELVRLHEHFDQDLVFMKFWQLELATSERALNSDSDIAMLLGKNPLLVQEVSYRLRPYSSADPDETLYVTPNIARFEHAEASAQRFAELFAAHVRRYEADEVLRECFGAPYSSTSAELLRAYSLVRALSAWLDTHSPEDRAAGVSEITDMFRRELLLTLSRHRAFVSRLFRGAPTEDAFEFFREYYGLRDDQYTRLFDELALDADDKGLLTSGHRDSVARLEMWLSGVPGFDPVRQSPWPRPDWVSGDEVDTVAEAPQLNASPVA